MQGRDSDKVLARVVNHPVFVPAQILTQSDQGFKRLRRELHIPGFKMLLDFLRCKGKKGIDEQDGLLDGFTELS